MDSEKLYMAYGSNLNLSQMKYRCPTAKVVGASEIKDYELVFRGGRYGAVATIEPCKGNSVPVLLWEIQSNDEKALDRYEGYPSFYEKEDMEVILNGGVVSAMVYVMTPGHEFGEPSEHYRRGIEEGYISAGFYTKILQDAVDKTLSQMEEIIGQGDIFGMKWW